MPADAGENIAFYGQQARLVEAAKFETVFLFEVSHVGPGNIPHHPHHRRLSEGGTERAAAVLKTERRGLWPSASLSYIVPNSLTQPARLLDIRQGR